MPFTPLLVILEAKVQISAPAGATGGQLAALSARLLGRCRGAGALSVDCRTVADEECPRFVIKLVFADHQPRLRNLLADLADDATAFWAAA